MKPRTLPKVNSTQFAGTVLPGFNQDYTFYLSDGEYFGRVYSVPKFSLVGLGLFREWRWFCPATLTYGRANTAQAATDALVKAYEQTLEAQS